ncbi:hypothetical protein [Psychrobacter urativorans]|uniref:hypothetical protein n=1 Tax=Psychrobacter urativorans TaxID=45610 RepID=UPI001918CE0C|nr:hypothetical protein [Psychrobacter urativorans]
MNLESLHSIVYKDPSEIASFIVEMEDALSAEQVNIIRSFLATVNFSPMKYEILQDETRGFLRKLIIGLVFGETNVLSFSEPSIKQSILQKFGEVCKLLSIDKKFIYPITNYANEICSYWD